MKRKILLISAYDAASHRYWRKGLQDNLPEFDWTQVALPPRYFSWRIRGNPLSLWAHAQKTLAADYDLLIASSMTDLATLRGLFPNLAGVPTLVYFHENQFAYPDAPGQRNHLEACMVNLYSALAADRILFNSRYNQESFLAGVEALIDRLPDFKPDKLAQQLELRSQVLPVPLDRRLFAPIEYHKPDVLTLVWNHRWEYDKAPERLYRALLQLRQREIPFSLNLIGQQFRDRPAVFRDLQHTFADALAQVGYITNRDAYLNTLRNSHIAISTALHEFQGLALLEAAACGCIPVAPDRLAYREYFDAQYLYTSTLTDEDQEATALADRLVELAMAFKNGRLGKPPDLHGLSWQIRRAEYAQFLQSL